MRYYRCSVCSVHSIAESSDQPGSSGRWFNIGTAALGAGQRGPGWVLHSQMAAETIASWAPLCSRRHCQHRTLSDRACAVLDVWGGRSCCQQHWTQSAGIHRCNHQRGRLDFFSFQYLNTRTHTHTLCTAIFIDAPGLASFPLIFSV